MAGVGSPEDVDCAAWAWGDNSQGQLGDGTRTKRATPVRVLGLTGIMAIFAGDYGSFAMKTDGTVWSWGYNALGSSGVGPGLGRYSPVRVQGVED